MDLQKQKQLINEFLDFKTQGEIPYFNFKISNGELKSFNNIIDFYVHLPVLDYIEVYVTPF